MLETNNYSKSISSFDQMIKYEDTTSVANQDDTNKVIQKMVIDTLDYGSYLSYAKYFKYVPGSPSILKHRALPVIGDSCRILKCAIQIKGKIDDILSPDTSTAEKVSQSIKAAHLGLQVISGTVLVDYLPEEIKSNVIWMNKAVGVAQVGCLIKEKIDEVGTFEKPSYAQTKEKLEVARLAITMTSSGLDLFEVHGLFRSSLSIGYGAVTIAKVGASFMSCFEKVAAPAA